MKTNYLLWKNRTKKLFDKVRYIFTDPMGVGTFTLALFFSMPACLLLALLGPLETLGETPLSSRLIIGLLASLIVSTASMYGWLLISDWKKESARRANA